MLFLLFYSCVMKDVDACFCLVIKKVNATFFQNSDVFSCNSEFTSHSADFFIWQMLIYTCKGKSQNCEKLHLPFHLFKKKNNCGGNKLLQKADFCIWRIKN